MASARNRAVRRVYENMRARAKGVTEEYVRNTIEDVLDGLAREPWKEQKSARACQEAWDSLESWNV